MRLWICERCREGATSGDGSEEGVIEDVEAGDIVDAGNGVGKTWRRLMEQTTSNFEPDLANPLKALEKKLTSAAAILSAGSGGGAGRGIA